MSCGNLGWNFFGTVARMVLRKNGGTPLAPRTRLNVREGAGVGVTLADNPAQDQADLTLAVLYGTAAGTACQGNDGRLSDARTPTGTAGGDLSGGYPNPTVAKVNGLPFADLLAFAAAQG